MQRGWFKSWPIRLELLHRALNHGMICEREVIMSTTTSEILESFDHLAEDEKREVASEIIRRTRELELPPLTDDELVLNAEALFLELDKRELRLGL